MDIVILKDGTPVRFDDTFTNKSFDGITGFLLEFDFLLIRFRHYQKDDFKISDQEKWTQLDGYYKETDYQNYMLKNSSMKYENILKFDFSKITAVADDVVSVDVLYLDEPYNYYFKNSTFTFPIQKTTDNLGIRNYRRSIYENVTLIGYEIDIPNNLTGNVKEKTPKNLATRYFYEANFGGFVDNWQVFNTTKRNIKKIVTQICFRISSIVRDIFPYITDLSVVDANADLRKDEFSGLNDYNTIIFELKKSWGYYYIPNSDPIYVNRQRIEPTFSGEPNYDEYLKYYESLTNFYFNTYKIRGHFITLPDDRRFNYLLGMISPAALAVIPLKIIKKCLSYYSKIKELDETSQRFIIHLISSIIKRGKSTDVDDFLLFLLDKENGGATNFEILYNLLTDGRVERIPYINMIFDEYTNKKYFAYAIYELWKVSKFNWDYFPPGTTPIPGQIYDGNFFIKNHDEFNTNNIFEFVDVDDSNGNLPFNTKVTFTSSFKNNKIEIYQTTRVLKYYLYGPLADEKSFEEFGLFHLYQPITLIGYKPNLDLTLVIPQRATIPAFLFHFAEEYKKIAEFDAVVSLSIDLTVNILLAYFGGGTSLLKNLNYLRYTKLGAAIIGEGVNATEAIVIWRNAEKTAELLTLSVAQLMAVNHYLTTTTTDELERKYLLRIQQLFLVLLILSIGGALYTRARASEEATRILIDIELLATSAHGVPEPVLQILRALKGDVDLTISDFLVELRSIDAQFPIGNILLKYEFEFDEVTQFRFWLDFRKLEGPSWVRFGASDDYLTNWLTLRNNGIAEANILDFIAKQPLVNNIVKYSNGSLGLKSALNALKYDTKVNFLERFPITDTVSFNEFLNNPKLIKSWGRYFEDQLMDEGFNLLNNGEQIFILEKYGDCTLEVFINIKSRARVHLRRFLEFREPTHNLEYFVQRRGEMLPPLFKDLGGDGKAYGIHEVDSFISLEINFGGKIRPSLSSEAGDVIIEGGTLNGKSLDPLGLAPKAIPPWKLRFTDSFMDFKEAITRHFAKISDPVAGKPPLDIVVIDYKYMDEISIGIGQNSSYLKDEVDLYIQTNFPQYNNTTYLLKLNY